jgi:hypothetical protein
MKSDLSAQTVRHLLSYDKDTGKLRWKNPHFDYMTGSEAGTFDADGYRAVSIGRSLYRAHRLIWLHVYGKWPDGVIDHINGNPGDNRIENLRDVTQRVNCENRRRPSSRKKAAGSIGVSWVASRGKWMASIYVGGKTKTLGRFATEESAAAAYSAAKRLLHPSAPIA